MNTGHQTQPVNNQGGQRTPVENLIAERQQENQFPLSDGNNLFEDGDWGLDFDEETGRIKITNAEKAVTPPPTRQGIVNASDENINSEGQNASQQNGAPSPADERIAKLEGVVQQLVGVVVGMTQGQGSNNLNQGEQQQQVQYDLTDQNHLAAFINQTISQAMKPMLEILPKIVERVTYQDARSKYGKDFDEAEPFIQEMMAGGGLTHDAAFKLYQKMKAKLGTSANTHGTSQVQAPKVEGTAEALISKANRVQSVQTGVNGSLANGKRQIASARDALEAAYEELSGGY